jgi:membrane protease YdiL (CAAX protease family)
VEKSLRKDANINSGLLLFFVLAAEIGIALIRPVLKSYFGEANRDTATVFLNLANDILMYAVLLPIVIIAARAFKQGIGNSLGKSFCKPQVGAGKIAKWIFMAFFVTYAGAFLLSQIFAAITQSAGLELNQISIDSDGTSTGNFIITLMTVIAAPIFEEILFRGVFLRNLEKYGGLLAIIFSAVMFGLWHTNYPQIPFAIIAGCCSGFIMVKTRSIIPSIIFHCSVNFFGNINNLLVNDISGDTPLKFVGILSIFVVFCFIIVGFILLIVTLVKHRDDFKLENNCKEISTSGKIKALWLAPVTVILIAVFIGFTIYNAIPRT